MLDSEQLKQALHNGVVELTFVKADGSVRVMRATLQESVLPPRDSSAAPIKQSKSSQAVWDTEADAWRSFRMDRLQSWTVL
jgi:hypothetical protein